MFLCFSGLQKRFYQNVFPSYHRCVRKDVGIEEDREIGAVIHGRVRKSYLCFTDTGTPVFTVSLVLDEFE